MPLISHQISHSIKDSPRPGLTKSAPRCAELDFVAAVTQPDNGSSKSEPWRFRGYKSSRAEHSTIVVWIRISVHLRHTTIKGYCHSSTLQGEGVLLTPWWPQNATVIRPQIHLHGSFSTDWACHLQNSMLQLKTAQKPCPVPKVPRWMGLYDWKNEHHSNAWGWTEGKTGQMMLFRHSNPQQSLVLHRQFKIGQYCLWQLDEQMQKRDCQGQTYTHGKTD